MVDIRHYIGYRCEEILMDCFSELIMLDDNHEANMPDFRIGNFFVEAKASFNANDYAARIKAKQVKAFSLMDKPVINLICFHNFERSTRKARGLNEVQVQKLLRTEMSLESIYVVDNSILEKMWIRGKRNSRPADENNYPLRESHLLQIIENRIISRNNMKNKARKYYGVPIRNHVVSAPVKHPRIKPYMGFYVSQKNIEILNYFMS